MEVGSWVASVYDEMWYIGRIEDRRITDDGEEELQIQFMESTHSNPKKFKWPRRKDVMWVDPEDIISRVSEPTSEGSSSRKIYFRIPQIEVDKVEEAFSSSYS